MNEIDCTIKAERIIDDKMYFVVQEKVSKQEHIVPKNQLDIFKDINLFKDYKFIKEYNQENNKTYLSIVHPLFKLDTEIDLKIIKTTQFEKNYYFELESDFVTPLTVSAFDWQKNLEFVKCKVVGHKRGRPKLINIDTNNCPWNIGDIKTFIIKEFSRYTDKSENIIDSVVLEIPNSDETVNIKTQKWQTQQHWRFPDISCKIIGILHNGLPKLITYDNRHPHYEIGKTYNFTAIGFTDKTSSTGYKYKAITLVDDRNFTFEVPAIPNQENRFKNSEIIECKVEDITTRVILKQVNTKDPYFWEFEDIVDDVMLKNKYFLKHLNLEDANSLKLKHQYDQKSGFWVFTYCNHILLKIKSEESVRRDLVEVIKIIDLHTKIETWILKRGILQAIHDDNERKLTKQKIQHIIKNNSLEKKCILLIIEHKVQELYKAQVDDANFIEIYYFIKYSEFQNLKEIEFLKFLLSIKSYKNEHNYIIKKLIRHISKSLNGYKNSLKQEYFILSQHLDDNQKKEIVKYVNWIYIQIHLSRLANLVEESNILASMFYRFNTLLINNKIDSEKLLLNAFYIISNPSRNHNIPIKLNNDNIDIQLKSLEENPLEFGIEKLDKTFYRTTITKKHYNGFKATIGNISGFLPIQNIVDEKLKQFKQDCFEWETNIIITLHCPKFCYFICKQIEKESENYFSKNLRQEKKLSIGSIIYGIVKNVTTFDSDNIGVFISTENGDGMIHQNEIADNKFNGYDYKKIFSNGDKIPVYVIGYNSNENLLLGFKQLIGTEYEEEHNQILNQYDLDIAEVLTDEDINYDYRIELEKGYIFEQFAFFQDIIESKIVYIKFAKAFFSNTNNARSFLLNIYIEYFNSIKKLDGLIQDYSIEKYDEFRSFIHKINEKVQPLTVENYPESKNLLFFIDILSLFNSIEENDLELVFNLVKKSINENEILLKAVAKIVLSNNLILTEIDKSNTTSLNDFTLNNLKKMREYINQGVLSVEEPIENIHEKELNKKRVYWRSRISEDEGEKLEFKATFITPIPNNEQNKIITSLRKEYDKAQSDTDKEKIKKKIESNESLGKNVKGIEKKLIHSVLKTICAYANTNGGHVLIGVSDDKRIYGLEQDYNSIKNDKNRDGFGKYFDDKIKDYFGDSFSSSLLEKEFLKFPEGDILIIAVRKSAEEVFILRNENGEKEEGFYVRNLVSSAELTGKQLAKFVKENTLKNLHIQPKE